MASQSRPRAEVKVKLIHEDAKLPYQANPNDAGFDIVAVEPYELSKTITLEQDGLVYAVVEYKTGLTMEIPEGYVGKIFPRSSISKLPFSLANTVGIIDTGYRGEVIVKFAVIYHPNNVESIADKLYKKGDRIAQLVIEQLPVTTFKEVDVLSNSVRGAGGFGSTGN